MYIKHALSFTFLGGNAILNDIELTICEMQGQLFELSAKEGYGSLEFIKKFMKSKTAYDIDKPFNHMQWAGEGYIIDRVDEEDSPVKGGEIYDNETLYWMGYIYRYWHFYTGELSKEIYKQANAEIMRAMYLQYHTMRPEMAIDRMKETYLDKQRKNGLLKKQKRAQ